MDTAAPALTVTSPQDSGIVSTGTLTLSGSIEDANPYKVSCNNRDGELVGGSFFFKDFSLSEGENILSLDAEDRAGNTASQQFTVYLDTTKPVIAITSPAAGALLGTKAVTVQGTAEDANLQSVRVNGSPCRVADGAFSIALFLAEGANTLTAEAVDSAGNSAAAPVQVNVDTTPPFIDVLSPQNNDLLTTASITISGRAVDTNLAAVTLAGQGAAISGENFTFSNINLSEGYNSLLIEATDMAGNRSSYTLTVTLDSTAPEITQITPAQDSAYVPVTSEITVAFSEDVAETSLTPATFYIENENSRGSATPADRAGQSIFVKSKNHSTKERISANDRIDGTIAVSGTTCTFTPTNDLPDSAVLTIHLTTGVQDKAGNAMAAAYSSSFTTKDQTPPAVPVIGELPQKTGLTAITISGASDAEAAVPVTGGKLTVETTCDAQGDFSVEVELLENRLNQLFITASDAEGNQSVPASVSIYQETVVFEVEDAEFAANRVRVFFSAPVAAVTLNSSTFTVRSAAGNETGTISISADEMAGIFVPGNDLSSQAIVVEVTTGVKDKEGGVLVYPFTKMFNNQTAEVLVQGEVYDDSTGLPITGAVVKLINVNGAVPAEPVPTAMTVKGGQYVLLLPAGKCVLRVEKEGYTYSDRVVLSAAGFSSALFDSRIALRNTINNTMVPEGGTVAHTRGQAISSFAARTQKNVSINKSFDRTFTKVRPPGGPPEASPRSGAEGIAG
mgnify:CR=1 FL=1